MDEIPSTTHVRVTNRKYLLFAYTTYERLKKDNPGLLFCSFITSRLNYFLKQKN